LQPAADRAEDAVGADGGLAAGLVVVERDEDAGAAEVGGLREDSGLPAGQRGAAGRQSGVAAGICHGDGDGVEGSFHDDRRCAAGEQIARLVEAEQQAAFLVAAGLGAVQVLRDPRPGSGAGAAEEPRDVSALVMDREHDPVPEVVDERAAGGDAGEPGGLDRVVVVAEGAEVAGQRGPAAGGVSDVPLAHQGVADAALGEVGGYPATGELAVVELHGVVQYTSDPRPGLRR
jgi:hypothetical protein